MSILDGMPKTNAQMREVLQFSAGMLGQIMANSAMPAGLKHVADQMAKGLSLADVAGITKDEREAYLLQGCRMLQNGDAAGAQQVLTFLLELEPTDERTIYTLAAAFQAQGDYAKAGKLYVHFLALDATNPEGYLRLGECFLGNKEVEEAIGCFQAAKNITAKAPRSDVTAYADKMIALAGRQRPAA